MLIKVSPWALRDIHSNFKFIVEVLCFVFLLILLAANLSAIFQLFSILTREWSVRTEEGKTQSN